MSAMPNLPANRQKAHCPGPARIQRDVLAKADLTKAFLSFTQAAGSLERSYAQLQAEVVRLTHELDRANTELERSHEENLRVRRYLACVLESLPCGVLVVNEKSEIQIANTEARKLLQVPREWTPGGGRALPESVGRLLSEAPANSLFLEQEWTSSFVSGIRTIGILRASINDAVEGVGETIWIVRDKTEEKRMAADRESARRSHALAEVATVLAHENQRQQSLNQLSNLVGISEINAGNGSLTITTVNGAPLVVGDQSFQLATQTNASGFQDILSQGSVITGQITGGELAGQLQIRDQEVPAVQNSLDALAFNLSSAVNTQHQAGFDLNGNAGGNLFTPLAGVAGAANQISIAITDPRLVAASGDGTPGDNSNANALVSLQNQNIIAGQRPLEFYGNQVLKIGNDVSNAQSNQQAGSQVLSQIQNLQGGISNVDINEESANLIHFQNAYEASARVVTVINTLLDATIALVQ